MFNSKFKKIATITALTLSLACGVVGCGKKEESSDTDTTVEKSEFSWDGVDMSSPRDAYQYVIDNVVTYIKAEEPDAKDYFATDYYYFDYDQDNANEVILLLTFLTEDDEAMADVWYLDYDDEKQIVYTLAKTTNDALDYCRFCSDADGEVMGRLSWTSTVDESYWYIVHVDPETKSLSYVLEEAYDHVVEDVGDVGLTILEKHLRVDPLPEDE